MRSVSARRGWVIAVTALRATSRKSGRASSRLSMQPRSALPLSSVTNDAPSARSTGATGGRPSHRPTGQAATDGVSYVDLRTEGSRSGVGPADHPPGGGPTTGSATRTGCASRTAAQAAPTWPPSPTSPTASTPWSANAAATACRHGSTWPAAASSPNYAASPMGCAATSTQRLTAAWRRHLGPLTKSAAPRERAMA